MARPAVFLDRDGTLNRDTGYLDAPERIEMFPGAARAVRALAAAGFVVVVVTNQSGIARGMLDEATLARIHDRVQQATDGAIHAFLHCPHHPDAGTGPYTRDCGCRKPADGLYRQAVELFDLETARSFAVGDTARDLIPARGLGARTVLVRTGKPAADALRELAARDAAPDHVADDLAAAAAWILATARRRAGGA